MLTIIRFFNSLDKMEVLNIFKQTQQDKDRDRDKITGLSIPVWIVNAY